MSFWDTETKAIPRQIVMSPRKVREYVRPVQTSLTLPGDKMLCVKQGQEANLFGPQTRHILVERDEKAQRSLSRQLRHLYSEWDPYFWKDDICKLPVRLLLGGEPLEFAYLDFCAALNDQTAHWTAYELAPSLADGATVACTLSRNYRNSRYMKWWLTMRENKNNAVYKEWLRAQRALYSAECSGAVASLDCYVEDSMHTSANGYMLPSRGNSPWNEVLVPEYHNSSIDIISSFSALFPYHVFDLEAVVEYRRNPKSNKGHSMTTFVLTDFQRLDEPRIPKSLTNEMQKRMAPPTRKRRVRRCP